MLWRPTYRPLFRDMMRLNRELDRFLSPSVSNGHSFTPSINVWMNEEEMMVSAELPGFDAAGIDISIEDNVLGIAGERPMLDVAEGDKIVRRERLSGGFNRSVNLPYRVAADDVTATFKNGVLTIILPRAEEDKPRKINIQTA